METDSHILAWQSWSLRVPTTWNPVKLAGDYDQGSMLLADLSSARLGIRWRMAGRGDPAKWADRALRDELGDSADHAGAFAVKPLDAWKITRVCLASDFPARDVFVGWSARSGRVIELVYNVNERDRVLEHEILPTLADTASDAPHRWSIFGLDLTTPPGHVLQTFALNAGDLALTFRNGRDRTTIRRISPASLALARQPIERWLTLGKSDRKIYRQPSTHSTTTLKLSGVSLDTYELAACRRLRLRWAWFIRCKLSLIAYHDESSNRLLIGTSTDRALLRQLLSQLIETSVSVDPFVDKRELAGIA